MAEKIAIKRLTASDSTLFKGVHRTIAAGNQKSINLNADVLTGTFYPALSAVAARTDNQITLAIMLYGPAARPAYPLSRKIIKNTTYKNWRLNGEFIDGPPGDTARYDNIHPGDLAVMRFKGAGEEAPSGMDLILVSQSDPADAALHSALNPLLGNRSMVAVTPEQVAVAAAEADAPDTHPVRLAAADPELDTALEDAAQGGLEGTRKLLRNRSGRRVSAADLARAKAKAELTGQEGEGLVNGYLAGRKSAGQITGYTWVSAENAVAPCDFETVTASGERTLIDAKTTGGPFENVIHLSMAEIIEAAGAVPYRIYRVYELGEDGGKLRISDEINPLARTLKGLLEEQMPKGVRADGFSIATSALQWGAEEYVERPEEDETP